MEIRMRRNLNVLVSELGPTQQNYYLIKNVNLLHEKETDLNIQVFVENLSRFCLKPNFSIMSVAEAWGQNGAFIATNLSTAAKLIHLPLASRKLFYVWDLEFLRGQYRVYEAYSPIYLHKDIELICRSKEHADLVENCFNKEVKHIVNNFDVTHFLEIVK
jgi:hypothetical protein